MEEEPRWFDLQDIADRSGLPVREVSLFKSFLRSGQLTHEIIRYIRHCIEQCGAIETNGITARVPIRTIGNTPIEQDRQIILGRIRPYDIVSVVEAEETGEHSDTSVISDDHTERDQLYSVYSDNVSNLHRINIFPGLRYGEVADRIGGRIQLG